MEANTRLISRVQEPALVLRDVQAPFRAPARWSALALAAALLATACAPTSAPVGDRSDRGVPRCDRNGDEQERRACGR